MKVSTLRPGLLVSLSTRLTGNVKYRTQDQGRTARVTDACALRLLMASGSALAKVAVERAELLAGRKVDSRQVALGAHSHDNGVTWHSHKG